MPRPPTAVALPLALALAFEGIETAIIVVGVVLLVFLIIFSKGPICIEVESLTLFVMNVLSTARSSRQECFAPWKFVVC